MDKNEIWQAALRARRAVMDHYDDRMEAKANSLGVDLPGLISLSAAYTFEPDPISIERLRVRVPYFAPAYYQAPLLGLVEAGCLNDAPEGGFYLNDRGHQVFSEIISMWSQGSSAVRHHAPQSANIGNRDQLIISRT